MAHPGESCATCFFVEQQTKRTLVGRRGQTNTSYTCHYETPLGRAPDAAPLIARLSEGWPQVEPTDWCGGWSSDGKAVYRYT